MRILIAPDSFKGSLSSKQAAQIIADSFAGILPDAEIVQCPLADGGEGTAEVLSLYLPEQTCLIESAQLIGLNLPQMRSLNVMQRGSGELGRAMISGLDAGRRDFIVALGGSATNDAGLGMLMALGMQALDGRGAPVSPNLAGLLSVKMIDISGFDSRVAESRLTVLSDVVSPLCGENGATAVYGPQKGVQTGDVGRVDRAAAAFAALCGDAFGFSPAMQEGAGAAGGLGFAWMVLGGEVVSGASFVMDRVGFREALPHADWVITGEGCSDAQSLQGKLPLKVAGAARAAGVKVALLSGSVDRRLLPELEKRFDRVVSARPEGVSREQAISQAESLLAKAAATFAAIIARNN